MDADATTLRGPDGPLRHPLGRPLRRPAGQPGSPLFLALCLGGALVFLGAVGLGAVTIPPPQVLSVLAARIGLPVPFEHSPQEAAVLLHIRLPRVVLALLVGAVLGIGGAAFQGLFRNPLADPGLLGLSSGGAMGAVAVIVLGGTMLKPLIEALGPLALPLAAFAGSLGVTALVYRLSRVRGRVDKATMLLAGIAVNALAGSVTALLVYLSDSAQLKSLTYWLMGNLGGADWGAVATVAGPALCAVIALPRLAPALNVMLMGESVAGHLGIRVVRVNRLVILLVTAGVGAAVAVSGVIGFVGLVAPHLFRLMAGPDHRGVLPGAALLGGILLMAADLAARTVAAPADLPIGIVTGAVGGPFFLWLLMRRRGAAGGA